MSMTIPSTPLSTLHPLCFLVVLHPPASSSFFFSHATPSTHLTSRATDRIYRSFQDHHQFTSTRVSEVSEAKACPSDALARLSIPLPVIYLDPVTALAVNQDRETTSDPHRSSVR